MAQRIAQSQCHDDVYGIRSTWAAGIANCRYNDTESQPGLHHSLNCQIGCKRSVGEPFVICMSCLLLGTCILRVDERNEESNEHLSIMMERLSCVTDEYNSLVGFGTIRGHLPRGLGARLIDYSTRRIFWSIAGCVSVNVACLTNIQKPFEPQRPPVQFIILFRQLSLRCHSLAYTNDSLPNLVLLSSK